MGMDVYGRNPTAPAGEYFRANVWRWHPLWSYCEVVQPEMGVRYGHSNDGDGLDARGAAALAEALTAELDSGRTAQYVAMRDAELASLPRRPCQWCEGTGVRRDEIAMANGMPTRITTLPDGTTRVGWCNACQGRGDREDPRASYPLDVDDVREFRDFLAASGGFEIW